MCSTCSCRIAKTACSRPETTTSGRFLPQAHVTHHHLVTDVGCPLPLETTLSLRLRCQGTPLSFIENVRWPHTPVLPTMIYLAEGLAIYYCRQAIFSLSNLTTPPYRSNGRYHQLFQQMSSSASTNSNHTLQSVDSYGLCGTDYTIWETAFSRDSVGSPEEMFAILYIGHDKNTGNVAGCFSVGQKRLGQIVKQIDFKRPGQDLQTCSDELKRICWDLHSHCVTVPLEIIERMMTHRSSDVPGFEWKVKAEGPPLEDRKHAKVEHPRRKYLKAKPWRFLGDVVSSSRSADGPLEAGDTAT